MIPDSLPRVSHCLSIFVFLIVFVFHFVHFVFVFHFYLWSIVVSIVVKHAILLVLIGLKRLGSSQVFFS